MKLHRYSERGLMNAWLESVARAPEPEAAMAQCLRSATWFDTRHGVRKLDSLPTPTGIEIYVEPSLSAFGDPDAVVFLEFDRDPRLRVLFIEAKNTWFLDSSPWQPADADGWYRQNSSSVLHELYLKHRFHQLQGRKAKAYLLDGSERWAGNDPQVRELAQKCLSAAPWYVAITTDTPPAADAPGWKTGDDIAAQFARILTLNSEVNGTVNPKGSELYEASFLLSWKDLAAVAGEAGLADLQEALAENLGKLRFPPPEHPGLPALLAEFWALHGLSHGPERKTEGRWTLVSVNPPRLARATYRVEDGFAGPEVVLYLVPESRAEGEPRHLRIRLDEITRRTEERAQHPGLT